MAIFNKGEQNVLQVGVSNRGGGGIQVKDKHGLHDRTLTLTYCSCWLRCNFCY